MPLFAIWSPVIKNVPNIQQIRSCTTVGQMLTDVEAGISRLSRLRSVGCYRWRVLARSSGVTCSPIGSFFESVRKPIRSKLARQLPLIPLSTADIGVLVCHTLEREDASSA